MKISINKYEWNGFSNFLIECGNLEVSKFHFANENYVSKKWLKNIGENLVRKFGFR